MKRFPCEVHKIMWCSSKCKSEWQRKNRTGKNGNNYKGGKIKKKCKSCEKKFKVFPKDKNQKYCSSKCYGEYLSTLRGAETSSWKNAEYYQQKRKSIEYEEWRINIFERDEYKCKKCNSNKKIQAHHIKNFASLYHEDDRILYDIENGITFCKKCHNEFHAIYGKIDNNLNQLTDFFK